MVQPEKKFKVGACTASIFANEVNTAEGTKNLRSVSLQRIYKDKEGNFQHTTNFKANDIPKAVLALSKAYEYLTVDEREA
ncbi:hypothetical protein MYX82_03850 [Acidobacteria bacterium AH-259-D05]|nr:hypothetical protein [Acidobacteria bacterium AH-259-D05]